jgi:phospholipase/carboxylesterase
MTEPAALLPAIELQTAARPDASVIWLHGLGADGSDFVPLVDALPLPAGLGVRFVFPHAPVRPVTINAGLRMRAWYDIVAADFTARVDLAGLRESQRQLDALVARECQRGIVPECIVVAGFSQGGAVALHAGLRYPDRLAAVIALSTYLADPESLAAEASAANRRVPMFMAHGSEDPLVRVEWGEASRRLLEARGYPVEWHTYPMPHAVVPEEIAAIGAFLGRVLRRPGAAPPR